MMLIKRNARPIYTEVCEGLLLTELANPANKQDIGVLSSDKFMSDVHITRTKEFIVYYLACEHVLPLKLQGNWTSKSRLLADVKTAFLNGSFSDKARLAEEVGEKRYIEEPRAKSHRTVEESSKPNAARYYHGLSCTTKHVSDGSATIVIQFEGDEIVALKRPEHSFFIVVPSKGVPESVVQSSYTSAKALAEALSKVEVAK
mgnify:CR=1 FL=1